MDMLKTGWNFFQNEVLGMAWLNRLIGNLINACELDATSKIGGSIQFFVYDTIKIMVLLGVLILIISYIQSYFPPERTKKILGRFHGIGANIISALLGTVTATQYRANRVRPFCAEPYGGCAMTLFLYREKPSEKHRDGKQVSSLRATTRIEGR